MKRIESIPARLPTTSRAASSLLSLVLGVASATACKSETPASESAPATGAAASTGAAAATGATAPTGEAPKAAPPVDAKTRLARVMTYLDPGARSVMMVRDELEFNPDAFAVVTGLPPGATKLLDARRAVMEGLEMVTGEDRDALHEWIAPEMMVMTPAVALRDYVVGYLAAPREDVIAKLTAAGMQKTELDGTTFLLPSGSFRFKIAFLDDDALVFVPIEEFGAGLAPATAGRDLPPSLMHTQLEAMLNDDPEIVLAMHGGGPMLHLDMSESVLASQLGLRRAGEGYEAQVVLQIDGDLDTAAKELRDRKHPEESQQIQALMKRVSFTVDREALVASILLEPADLELLR